jgi:hypothetical protein
MMVIPFSSPVLYRVQAHEILAGRLEARWAETKKGLIHEERPSITIGDFLVYGTAEKSMAGVFAEFSCKLACQLLALWGFAARFKTAKFYRKPVD